MAAMAGAAMMLAGCNDEAKTFGRSYDECVLKNASGTPAQAALAEPSCRRRFELKSATGAGADVSATIHTQGSQRWITFNITNSDPSKIITAVNVDAVFLGKDGKELATLTWTFATFLEPDRQVELTGSMPDPWPSEEFTSKGTVTRELPIGR
ncbi:MAG: hypothetical protein IM673_13320 [Phenylobacterium sp.]|uniref:hypothetical protein n=1 Tax=Phenylobacterium sp. TaxID=1871053 RepID=UPI0025CCD959|nr:hypothetical protein [Phenylobacterium sp.]MCA3739017.1 hypothetical protein [Phenylobacterium sp.]